MFSSFEISIFFSFPFKIILFFFFILLSSTKMMVTNYMKVVGMILMNSFFFIFQIVLVVFTLIFFFNFFSLIPGSIGFSSLGVSLFFSFSFWLASFLYVIFKFTNYNLAHFLPVGTPLALVFLLVWIEVISMMARPIALGVRLMANITAGHLLMHLGSSGLFNLNFFFSLLVFPVFMALMFLEIGVAMIQTYVFSMLLSLYTAEGVLD
uniref:ATP synthase subunit a n=1 Tax=Clavelina lepadiformis TaxID=159417 RepID=C6GCR6_CLALP|nr:ATP synthase F0 subunit 6 [Clavelina lepadiformis]ACO40305.1 ATP synthase F0 subunit 6 [Clavelina lepadiformis]CAL24375.1 ATPase subunit 6 [Clavelina lepadiformis]